MDGETISYDAIGNPTSYYNGTSWSFTWARGRSLATASNGTNTISYTYDADGLRTGKTVNGTEYTYHYAGGKLLRETFGTTTLDFFYDASGTPYALKYNGTLYYYVTNLQGDVMSIVDAQGEVVAEYEYDPYGNILTATGPLADVNPLRYRGYVYDSETRFYYLQSRYYDPEIGRFINADGLMSTGQGIIGNNMFVYCGNNPVNCSDPDGNLYRSFHWQIDYLFFEGFGGIRAPKMAPVMLDLSVSGPVIGTPTYWKVGVTFIADPTNTEINMYFHGGLGVGFSPGISPSVSVGTVSNYTKSSDGEGFTYDADIANHLELDHSWNPAVPYEESTKTLAISYSSGFSVGFGSDYYSRAICIVDWECP